MTSHSIRFISLALLTLSGCTGGEVTPSRDAAETLDAWWYDASDIHGDVGPRVDALRADDAFVAIETDAASEPEDAGGSDAPSACGNNIDDGFGGVCDGRGMAACMMWATRTGGAMASAICLSATGGCARASECSGGTVDTCRCGGEPACEANEVCVSGIAGYSCICAP